MAKERWLGSFRGLKAFARSYCGENGRQNALDYAQQRARSGLCDVQVMDKSWNVAETFAKEDLRRLCDAGDVGIARGVCRDGPGAVYRIAAQICGVVLSFVLLTV